MNCINNEGIILSGFIDSRPQELCLMCGKCCRVVTTANTYGELLELCEKGEEGAIDFLDIFVPYDSIEAARAVCPQTVENILKNLPVEDVEQGKVIFYGCKYLLDNNLCGNYENRKELCKRFPASPWVVAPPGCGYEGYLAEKRVEIIEKVKEQKNNIAELEEYLKNNSESPYNQKVKDAIRKSKKIVRGFEKYGANDW